jgi:hypothetical protein
MMTPHTPYTRILMGKDLNGEEIRKVYSNKYHEFQIKTTKRIVTMDEYEITQLLDKYKNSHGGKREGAGRKAHGGKRMMFRISEEAQTILDMVDDKSRFINDLILSAK